MRPAGSFSRNEMRFGEGLVNLIGCGLVLAAIVGWVVGGMALGFALFDNPNTGLGIVFGVPMGIGVLGVLVVSVREWWTGIRRMDS